MSGASQRVRVLWVGTKPPWPPVDGGRLVAALTIDALRRAGADVTVVTPSRTGETEAAPPSGPGGHVNVRAIPRSWPVAALGALASRRPVTIARHAHRAVQRAVALHLATHPVDVVHVEQPHAFANVAAALDAVLPVVARAHNVEHQVWRAAAEGRPWPLSRALHAEAGRMASFEAAVVRAVTATVALTPADRDALQALAPGALVVHVPPPFASDARPPATTAGSLEGDPAVVWCGSAGWTLNDHAARWLVDEVWPAIRRRLPGAVLHAFTAAPVPGTDGVLNHGAAGDSARIFDPSAVLALPLRVAAGVRMRLLEAWSRGMPVVATPAAAAGLDAEDGRNLLLATSPAAFADAGARVHGDAALRARLAAGGDATLRAHHAPADVAGQLLEVYARAVRARAGAAGR